MLTVDSCAGTERTCHPGPRTQGLSRNGYRTLGPYGVYRVANWQWHCISGVGSGPGHLKVNIQPAWSLGLGLEEFRSLTCSWSVGWKVLENFRDSLGSRRSPVYWVDPVPRPTPPANQSPSMVTMSRKRPRIYVRGLFCIAEGSDNLNSLTYLLSPAPVAAITEQVPVTTSAFKLPHQCKPSFASLHNSLQAVNCNGLTTPISIIKK